MTVSRMIRIVALVSAAALASIAHAGCMESKFESTWRDSAITIDGKAPEWAGKEAYYDENEGLKIGFSNDECYVYVYLSTWDQQLQRQILMNGLTVWFDAEGKKREVFGVNYPIQRSAPGRPDSSMFSGEAAQTHRGYHGARGSRSPGDMQRMLAAMLNESRGELHIIGAGKEPIAMLAATDSGATDVEAMIDIANRTLIYELKLPLARGEAMPYGIGAEPGGTIGIGFKVGTREPMKRRQGTPPEGMGEAPGEGGFPGGGGGGGFPGGGMRGSGEMAGRGNIATLDLWAKVTLASGPPKVR